MNKGRLPLLGERPLLIATLLVACLGHPIAGLSQPTSPVRSLLEIRRENVIVQKWDVSCGAAALATLLTYQHGLPISERAVAEGMLRRTDPLRVKFRGGFSLLDLKRYAETKGLKANAFLQVQQDDLESFKPAIVPINLRGYPHFVIYRGKVGEHVLLSDPAFGNRIIRSEDFQQTWQQNIAFVVTRPDGTPPPNRLEVRTSDFLQPSSAVVRSTLRW